MSFKHIARISCNGDDPLGYTMVIEDLQMVITLIGEKSNLFELRFDGVQLYKFVPDDLAILRDDIELDTFQRALDKRWIDELRVPSHIHRQYLEGHDLYVLHVADVGLLEVVAISAQLKAL